MLKKSDESMNRNRCDALCELKDMAKTLYGGHFIDHSQSKLNVNVIESGSRRKLLPESLAGYVEFRRVPYSLEELSALQSAVTETLFDMRDLGVNMADVDVMRDCVTIGVDDDSPAIRAEVEHELATHGFTDRGMYHIVTSDRIGDEDAVPAALNSTIQPLSSTTPVTVMPGGWLGRLKTDGTLEGVASLTGAVYYNGNLYLMTAGHGGPTVGSTVIYAAPPASGTYPMNGTDLQNYAPNDRIEVGTVAIVRYGGYFDFASVRVTNPNLTVDGTAYNSLRPELFGGTPQIGQVVRFTGVTSKHAGELEFGYCRSIQASYQDVRGVTLKDVISVDLGGNGGTSGGPLFMYDLLNDNKVNLIGTASSTVNGTTMFVKFSRVMNEYNLMPYFPDLGGGSR